MKRGQILSIALVVTISCLLVPAPGLSDDWDAPPDERDIQRIRRKVETLRAWRLTEELDLDEETNSRLFPAMREGDKARQRIERENRRLVRTMAQEIKSDNPDRSRISQALDKLQENRREMARVEEHHMRKVRDILSPEDTAHYLLFQIRFQREIRKRVSRSAWERDSRRFGDEGNGRGGSGGGRR